MIHTATLTYSQITKEIRENFFNGHDTLVKTGKGSWSNYSYKQQGISVIEFKINKKSDGTIFNILKCRINLRRLIDQDNHVKVFTPQDYDNVILAFNTIMEQLQLPYWHQWTANRVDYCVDVRTPYVKEYIHLLQKGDIPYHQKIAYDKLTRNNTHKKGSVYLPAKVRDKRKRKTGSITINFYDKLQEKTNKGDAENELLQAKDILRLEVQCHKPKLESIKQKYKLEDKAIYHFIDERICNDVIESAIFKIAKKGDYYRRSMAIDAIKKSTYHTKTKKKLIQIITDISKQKQSISKARIKYMQAGMDRHSFSNCLRKLDNLGINPVTIPDTQKLKYKQTKEGLCSIYDLFHDAFYNELTTNDVTSSEPALSVKYEE